MTTEIIVKDDYKLLQNLKNEEDALNSFVSDYNDDVYLCDAISEIADNFIPIYTHDLWENAKDIREYIEEAVSEGLTEGCTNIEDFMKAGYYQYYTRSLYDNLDIMVFNIMVDKMNAFLSECDLDIDSLDMSYIKSGIRNISESYDNNNTFSNIHDDINDFIEEIKNN